MSLPVTDELGAGGRALSRRTVLGLGVGMGAALGLGACGSPSTSHPRTPPAGAPAYTPLGRLPTPDIPGSADGTIPPTWLHYPDPVSTVAAPPGDGAPVRILTETFGPIPPSGADNPVWANLEQALGSPLQIQIVPQADYATKFATTVAGNALPDMFFVDPNYPRLPDLLDARGLDLTEHLQGEAILRYPNLANIPSACWDVGRFNGRLYGLPSPRGAISSGVLLRRDDLLAAKGITGELSSFAQLLGLAQELTNPAAGVWAFTTVPLQFIRNMLRIPNFWQYRGGTMHSWWTAPEQEQALEAGRQLVALGTVNPDAFSAPNKKTWFTAGKAYFTDDAISSWPQYFGGAPAGFDLGAAQIPSFDGGGSGRLWLSFPSFGMSAISQGSAARVDTLLKVADYLAAPFGSAEYLTVRYGKAGRDYTMKDGSPSSTKAAAAASQLGLKYIVDAPAVSFVPGRPDAARKLDAFVRAVVPDAMTNDAVYLWSKTSADRFSAAQTRFSALENDILQGRQPVSAWRSEADDWWQRYGRQMADELTASYHEAGRG